MIYREFEPGSRLKPYVKSFFYYESSSAGTFVDTVFPSGCMEIIFNLGSGRWQTMSGTIFDTTPRIELWGQITKPLPIQSVGKNIMLGVRFFPYAAGSFFKENIEEFNNQVIDYNAVEKSADTFHQQLLNTPALPDRISMLEEYIWARLSLPEKRKSKVALVHAIMQELRSEDFFDNIENVAARHHITSRYLQKIFLQYTGLTPKLYSKIHRFQNSLSLVIKNDGLLTDIAYDCGYADQSHFIREFKSFTGLTPSGYAPEKSPLTVAFAGN